MKHHYLSAASTKNSAANNKFKLWLKVQGIGRNIWQKIEQNIGN
jgi:hypothetical protein